MNSGALTWFDFEVASALDLKASGTFAYATHDSTRAIVLAYAIGDGPVQAWHTGGTMLDWEQAPDDLRAAFDNSVTCAAWNASFDSCIWNFATLGFPLLAPERVIDPMIQAGVSNLPTDLESAARALGGVGKQKDGKKLIKLFCVEGANPADHPEDWQRFLAYARQDVEAMREVYRRTRPLPLNEWEQYWAFEHINQRGVCLDMPYVRRAAALAAEDGRHIGRRLSELTDGTVTRVTQAKRIATWMHDQLADAAMREILTLGVSADDGDDDDDAELELSLARDRVARVLAMLEAKRANGGLDADETKAFEAATLRLYGAGASPKKFARLAAQQVDGVLRGQYRFAGAGQTGRLTSKGAQVQNLTRDVLGEDGAEEARLVDLIADGCDYNTLVAANPVDVPAARKLALLVRPAIIAAPDKTFVWSDWSAIEARVTPWLAATPGADKVLDIFRNNDADPSRPDIYTLAAADILNKAPELITREERAIGKVAVLALGFGGSIGALQSMALNYRIHLDDAKARQIVSAWREANWWAREFWDAIWDSVLTAWELPGHITQAGRLAFVYREDYLGGTLFMALPSGRLLTYPRPRWREVEVKDKRGNPTGEKKTQLSFARAGGRAKLWHGTLCENAVQATAADLLRATVTRIETDPALTFMPIRMTTHDEIVCEADEARTDEAKEILRREMLTLPDWAEGLPLQSEESVCRWYTKSKTVQKEQVVSDTRQYGDARALLRSLTDGTSAAAFFDPQHRSTLERLQYGNEGARQKLRCALPAMSDSYIEQCCRDIARVLRPHGYLFLWVDAFRLCRGDHLHVADVLPCVDLIAWDNGRFGMGYRSRRCGDYLLILQKPPLRAKTTWRDHGIRDRWVEKVDARVHPHIKPASLIRRLIAAVTAPGDLIIDPAAGSFLVMHVAHELGRRFIGCDISCSPTTNSAGVLTPGLIVSRDGAHP